LKLPRNLHDRAMASAGRGIWAAARQCDSPARSSGSAWRRTLRTRCFLAKLWRHFGNAEALRRKDQGL